ncbi:hypothetical protein RHGRI_026110 [Rhododendron griersonianum]|uniref:Uncharacterized protein n=1 Tax=Rhododendron griersonianum TaxID=479676 RepID=A0AAV6ISX3_9ERIC|nr:hypothetical protein RHGRI_026110 [Rhododendron griersonianum]
MGGISSDNVHGLVLAISSSVFIGSSFIIKKKGLKKAGAFERLGLTCARRVTHRLTEVDLFLVGLVEAMQKSAHETCADILLFRFGRALLLEGTLVVGWDGNE